MEDTPTVGGLVPRVLTERSGGPLLALQLVCNEAVLSRGKYLVLTSPPSFLRRATARRKINRCRLGGSRATYRLTSYSRCATLTPHTTTYLSINNILSTLQPRVQEHVREQVVFIDAGIMGSMCNTMCLI